MKTKTFNLWMKQVEQKLLNTIGLSHLDLPDFPFRDWFDDGISVSEAVGAVLDESEIECSPYFYDDSPDVDALGMCFSDADSGL